MSRQDLAEPYRWKEVAPSLLDAKRSPATARAPHKLWSRRVAIDIIAALDVLGVLGGAFVGAALFAGPNFLKAGAVVGLVQAAFVTAIVAVFILRQLRMYDTGDMRAFPSHAGWLAAAIGLTFLVILAVGLSFGTAQRYSLAWLASWYAATFALIVTHRKIAAHLLKGKSLAGHFHVNLAVFGGGRIARKLFEHVQRDGGSVKFVGLYDDREPGRVDTDGLGISGDLNRLIEHGRAGKVDEIIIALPQSADRRIADIARKLEQLPVRIRICTHIASDLVDARGEQKVSNLGPIGLLDIKAKPLSDWGPFLKRLEDYLLASFFFVLALPIFLIAAAAIKLTSSGPVFFRQHRHGLNHKVIEVVKFRTMRVMEDGENVRQASRNDARITIVGKLLRRTSLDELPQLINVLKGDMSIVGPRPHALVHNEFYGEMLERYANRHQVKPGITGWAQINGFRGETKDPAAMQSRVEHDLAYIDNWSIWLDLKIIALTPIYGLVHAKAY